MLRMTSQQGLITVSLVAICLAVLFALGGSGYLVYKNRPEPNAKPSVQQPQTNLTPVANPDTSISPQVSKPESKTFDPEIFYGKIQTGMDLSTLNQLAGKIGDCATTGAYPPPETYPCYWSNGEYIVAVTLSGQGVTNKSIRPNKIDSAN